MNNLKDIHNHHTLFAQPLALFYQDFNEQFEGYTQRVLVIAATFTNCFIRISMNNLKDIHNSLTRALSLTRIVLSGFQ